MILDSNGTVQADLRSGCAPWLTKVRRLARSAPERNMHCDSVVVGAGITGALMAEHLSSLGQRVCIIDRERPGYGSTAASTAMLLWEIDASLSELTTLYGFERAADVYRRSFRAVAGLQSLVLDLGLDCMFRPRSSLYIAGGATDQKELLAEAALRRRAGLPGQYLDYRALQREFDMARRCAIVSPGAADADPLLLSHALIAAALGKGAAIFDAEAVSYECAGRSVNVVLDNGCSIEASHVVLATGYVMPEFIQATQHKVSSSWALATAPLPSGQLWRDGVLIWEASDDYLYARTTEDDRIIVGGEDDAAIVGPEGRNDIMSAKAVTLLGKLQDLWPVTQPVAEFTWSGAFGETRDGLPLIGAVPGYRGLYAAYGYGGNGITFSYLASRMIGRMMAGRHAAWHEGFALDRSIPAIPAA